MPRRQWLGPKPEAVLRRLLLVLVVVLITRGWICSPVLIRGNSMLPTLRSGQLALLNKLAYRFGPPQRGDIVLVWTGTERWTKRIVGLPGEEIEVRHGTLFINGRPLQEPYVALKDSSDIAPGKMGPKCFVVAGDNRQGTWMVIISRERIVGRVLFLRIRPLKQANFPLWCRGREPLTFAARQEVLTSRQRLPPKSTSTFLLISSQFPVAGERGKKATNKTKEKL